jgi:hypothetical protein
MAAAKRPAYQVTRVTSAPRSAGSIRVKLSRAAGPGNDLTPTADLPKVTRRGGRAREWSWLDLATFLPSCFYYVTAELPARHAAGRPGGEAGMPEEEVAAELRAMQAR